MTMDESNLRDIRFYGSGTDALRQWQVTLLHPSNPGHAVKLAQHAAPTHVCTVLLYRELCRVENSEIPPKKTLCSILLHAICNDF
jgi:hypothetical protein